MNIGIDIGGSHIAVGLVQDIIIIIKKEHNWTDQEKSNFWESVEKYSKNLIKEIIEENTKDDIEKIGIGFPAANITDGKVTKFGKTIDLTKILSEYFNIPTFLKNDVKCSALCEKKYGSLKKYKNCLFMTLGTGIGGAYFYNGRLVKPSKFQGFEIGHMIIEKDGKQCNCGNKGCLEQYASMRIFRNKIEDLFNIKNVTSYKFFELLYIENSVLLRSIKNKRRFSFGSFISLFITLCKKVLLPLPLFPNIKTNSCFLKSKFILSNINNLFLPYLKLLQTSINLNISLHS